MSAHCTQNLQGGIAKRLAVIGAPGHLIQPFAELVTKWVSCSGREWTIERLKSLKVDLIREHAGVPAQSSWIRKNQHGRYYGTIGSIFRWASGSERAFQKAVQVLMVYSMFTLEKVSKKQAEKFVSAVCNSEESTLTRAFLRNFGRSVRTCFPLLSIDRRNDNSLLLFRGSPSKRLPGFSWSSSTPQNVGAIAQANYFYLQEHKALGRRFSGLYQPVLAGLKHHLDMIFDHDSDVVTPDRCYGGNIAFIQEPGAKLRSVASPYLVHQMALKPLGDSIYRFVSTLPWDCTHNQSKPFDVVRDHLTKGSEITSIDLSNATDHFPLSVQLCALKSIFSKQPDIDLFEVLSRSTWRSPLGNITWKKGQPLGLYPSFGTFTLTHGLLLWHLNGNQFNNDFYVVGDDVIILNPTLAGRYKEVLQQMGCPWSPSKSVVSNKLCEFAGKIITPTKVIPQLKWREMSNDNFLDLCRMLGPRSRQLLSSRQKRVFDCVKHCLLPLGLNFSYPGSDYLAMLDKTREVFPVLDVDLESLTGLSSVVNTNVFTSEFKNPSQLVEWQVVLDKLETFDEKVREVFLELLGWVPQPISGFSRLPQALGNSELPLSGSTFGRCTTLERLEKLLAKSR